MAEANSDSKPSSKPKPTFTLEFPYRRSVGPVIGKFLAGLRERQLFGATTPAGRVLVPPLEYDPETGEATTGLVPVEETGVVTGFSWVAEPNGKEPIDRPFAWALVKLDGADTSMLHALDAGSPEAVRTGLRVRVRWAAERRGHMSDIECFEPEH